ncbi:amidase [Bacillus daqingensis]|uniref:Amidase n=1 Tax=Bacillus daqingensis TaxID=872396 RepID=A0ABV9NUI3_9BACI
MKKVLLLLVVTAMAAGIWAAPAGAASAPNATWLWNPWMFVEDESGTIAFLKEKNVERVFVQIDRSVPQASYRSFIRRAGTEGISVYALDGAPEWAAPKGDRHLTTMMNWLGDYQKRAGAAERFQGVHLDVEPYLLSSWNSNRAKTIADFQSLLLTAKRQSAAAGLPLEADLPFWFDEISFKNKNGSGNLAEWVIQQLDGVTLMAYRDTASAINEIVKNEMAFAAKHKTPVTVGVETMQSHEGNHVTFFEEGEAYMKQQLDLVSARYAGPYYGGTAIHHVDSWKTMKP